MVLWSQKHPSRGVLKRKIHYPFKWIQLIEWSNYLNMNSRLHLSNKLKECGKFLWIRFWNLCFISMKESIFSKVPKLKFNISIFIGFAKSVSYLALWASRNNFLYKIPPTQWTHDVIAMSWDVYTTTRCRVDSCNDFECLPVNVVLMVI